ncbi:hypothetical protein ECZU27_51480 [Escherichia coli]|nr:hypothetical protein ECZU27_51480 [Escherichia coli]
MVSVPRPVGTGRALYRSRLAPVTVYASPSPFLMNALQAAFAAALPSERRRLRYSTVGLTRYRTR